MIFLRRRRGPWSPTDARVARGTSARGYVCVSVRARSRSPIRRVGRAARGRRCPLVRMQWPKIGSRDGRTVLQAAVHTEMTLLFGRASAYTRHCARASRFLSRRSLDFFFYYFFHSFFSHIIILYHYYYYFHRRSSSNILILYYYYYCYPVRRLVHSLLRFVRVLFFRIFFLIWFLSPLFINVLLQYIKSLRATTTRCLAILLY